MCQQASPNDNPKEHKTLSNNQYRQQTNLKADPKMDNVELVKTDLICTDNLTKVNAEMIPFAVN